MLHDPGFGPRRQSIQRTPAGTLAHHIPDVETWHDGALHGEQEQKETEISRF